MTRRSPSRRWPAGLAAGLLLACLSAGRAAAQRQTVYAPPFPATVKTTNTVTIGASFAYTPGPLVQNSQSGNLCSPGACYDGSVVTRGNQAWRVQVRLTSTPANFTVRFIRTTTPPTAQPVNNGTATELNPTTWVTIASGAGATSGVTVNTLFNANKTSGKNGKVPTAAELAAVLTYQVVAP